MEYIKQNLNSIIKTFIVIFAAGNLIFLFVFDYQLPFFSRIQEPQQTILTEYVEDTTTKSDTTIQLSISDQPLYYDGSETLDLLQDVEVTDSAGTILSDIPIFTTIRTGSSLKEKIVEYSATHADGTRVTAQRTLQLGDNYTGPNIQIIGELPDISEEQLSTLPAFLISQNLIFADDGFGKDISSAITSTVSSDTGSDSTTVTLTVQNMVNDTYSTDITIAVKLTSPTIKLTTNAVTLHVGDTFNFYNYLDYAQDIDGTDLSHYISVTGSVDTSTPGQYSVTFYCTNKEGVKSPEETLVITVE